MAEKGHIVKGFGTFQPSIREQGVYERDWPAPCAGRPTAYHTLCRRSDERARNRDQTGAQNGNTSAIEDRLFMIQKVEFGSIHAMPLSRIVDERLISGPRTRRGMAAIRLLVYSDSGLRNISSVSPQSTILPWRITMTRSLI
jgi:hypothetical protein